MSSGRPSRVLAVFGGDPTTPVLTKAERLAEAERLGQAIAGTGNIVLTGAYEPADDTVKGIALPPVESSPWVGVDRCSRDDDVHWSELGRGFRMRSNLDHKRNYLEAHLSDGVAAIEGGNGTVSEVVCALWLGRPVAMVGSWWKESYDLDKDREGALRSLLEAAGLRFAESRGSSAADPYLKLMNIEAIRNRDLRYRYFKASEGSVSWLIQALDGLNSEMKASFPALAGHEGVVEAYQNWRARY